ncbi:MAG TPA: hypothetical protein VGI45_19150 [Terracidiphilus sp.]|jgi:endogenous inhibitor of DNA gyrase (YacG/DUF329 family)
MDEFRPSASAATGDEHYRDEWSFFYAERRRLLIRLFWFAGGLAVSALLLVATLGDHYPPLVLRNAIAVSFGLFLIAFLCQWFFFLWEMANWPCPKCAKRFFFSAFAFDPFFTRRCRHCGLLRLKNAGVKNLKREERQPELQ